MKRFTTVSVWLLVFLVLAGLPATSHAQFDLDEVNTEVGAEITDVRHPSALGTLTFSTGSEAEKQALIDAIDKVRSNFLNEQLWRAQLGNEDPNVAQAEYESVRDSVVAAMNAMARTIRDNSLDPQSEEFARRWSGRVNFTYGFDDVDVACRFGEFVFPCDPLPPSRAVTKHIMFASEALKAVWNAFTHPVVVAQVNRDAERAARWRTFNDIAYSMYPWEQWINGARIKFGDLNDIPKLLVIVAHPSLGIELSKFDYHTAEAREALIVEVVGVQFLKTSGSGPTIRYERSFGASIVGALADQRPPAVGAMIHIGTAFHAGVVWRDQPPAGYADWTPVMSLDLYRLVK